MKALLLTEYSHLDLADLPRPTPGPGEVLVEVAACSICGSDVHGYDGSSGVIGHEAAGTIAETGPGVEDFAPGDRVTFDSTVYCGECHFCKQDLINLCDNRQVIGVSTPDFRRAGAFAEYVVVPERIVYKLPDEMPFPSAAMLEAVAVAVHAVNVTELKPTDTALVIGAGMIGLLIIQALAAQGCQRIFVADVDQSRLRLAKEAGANETLISSSTGETDSILGEIRSQTEGRGVDVVLEAVGRNETVAAAIEAVRKGGTVTLVGNITPTVTLPLQKVVSRQIRLQGSCASCGEYPESIRLISEGKVNVDSLITSVAPLEDGADWFHRLYHREPNLMKIVLDPRMTKN